MRRAVVTGAVVGVILLASACKRGGAHTCANDPQAGCACKNETFQLGATMKPVDECASAPEGVPWRCCHDLDSKGESSYCTCARAVCYRNPKEYGPDACFCDMRVSIPEGATVVPSCEGTSKCCFDKEAGSCGCGGTTQCEGNLAPVDRCTPATVRPKACDGAARDAKTCTGLKWKSKS